MNETLPPKTCSIERLVTQEAEVNKVLAGQKKACRRNGRYADLEEIMELQGKKFKITRVYTQSLGELTDRDAQMEGFSTLEAYKESILSIHPGMPWLPHMKVWVHEFEAVE